MATLASLVRRNNVTSGGNTQAVNLHYRITQRAKLALHENGAAFHIRNFICPVEVVATTVDAPEASRYSVISKPISTEPELTDPRFGHDSQALN